MYTTLRSQSATSRVYRARRRCGTLPHNTPRRRLIALQALRNPVKAFPQPLACRGACGLHVPIHLQHNDNTMISTFSRFTTRIRVDQ
jgi:hypothetical protein